MKKYIIALDQGTTSSRAIIFDHSQRVIAKAQKEFKQYYPKAGYVEHDPMDIYASQYAVLMEAIAQSGIEPTEIAGIGITNQRETTIVWEKATGNPVHNAIVWQCRRTAPMCDELIERGLAPYIKENTGLPVDAYFSATKVKWILDNVKGARKKAENGELLFGTVDTWLLWKLTDGAVHVTDYTNASRTMMFNIKNLCWDEKILAKLDIPQSMLPQVHFSDEIYGYCNIAGRQVPIASLVGDQQGALFGQCCFEEGKAKNTYGTGCFLLANSGKNMPVSKNGLLTTIGISAEGKISYALEGSVFVGGAVIQWLRDELGLLKNSAESEAVAAKAKDNGGVYIVPAFTGMGAPYWDMYARGSIFGLTRGANRSHLVRAALESIAYQTEDVLCAMNKDNQIPIKELRVDGGASTNDLLMAFQADISGLSLKRPVVQETTALGAAYLAGLATGFWQNKAELEEKWHLDAAFTPKMPQQERQALLQNWHKAVKRAQNWVE